MSTIYKKQKVKMKRIIIRCIERNNYLEKKHNKEKQATYQYID